MTFPRVSLFGVTFLAPFSAGSATGGRDTPSDDPVAWGDCRRATGAAQKLGFCMVCVRFWDVLGHFLRVFA